ncbi:MAG TPA: tRNA pseudouridine synthase A [Chitinophagales bacterium]|nr:tRNA pseudouridine synthase A [Chitinophagales bacterium]
MRYFINLSYDGTSYSGWQVQLNAPSVQQTINEALQKLLGHKVGSYGCGRTDAGVHAKDFYMHFSTESDIVDIADFRFRLNCVLPYSISVHHIFKVEEKAHARFDATERTYEYFIHFDKSPFINLYSFYQGYYKLDWGAILKATEVIKDVSDFTSLCLPSPDFKTNICKITQARWDVLPAHHYALKGYDGSVPDKPFTPDHCFTTGELLRFTISSNRFLRGMVRKIVGTLLVIGKGKLSVEEFEEIVKGKKDFRIHYLAPPNGLFLSKIKYPYING